MTTSSPTAHKASLPIAAKARRGFTLVEIMVVVVISGMILGGVMSTYMAILKSSMRLWNYEKMEREANKGLELFARDVRMANAVVWNSSSSITLTVPPAGAGSNRTILYDWNSGMKTFNRTEGGATIALVRDVQSFAFNRFNLAQAPAVNDFETNQIQVTMTAAPRTNGVYVESSKRVLSARFVLRNR